MPAIFDDILGALSDGKPHRFEDILWKCKTARDLNEAQMKSVLKFLETFALISRSFGQGKWTRYKLTLATINFLKELKKLEDAEDEEEVEARNGIAKEMET